MDYAGPLYIKEPDCSTTKKVYIRLFTCCWTRAIHLELGTDLSADEFIRCLRRFTARRGLPEIIVSDNAKTFKSAAKILRKGVFIPKCQEIPLNRRISWMFNMDRAHWWGGFFSKGWYRKRNNSLRMTLGNVKLDYVELHTILVEVEGTLNSRPLTFVSSDVVEEPLTPYHWIYGRGILTFPDFTRNREASLNQAVSSGDLPRRRKYMQLLLEHFWKSWSRQYVTELRNLPCHNPRPEKSISRSVVTLFEDNLPRSQ